MIKGGHYCPPLILFLPIELFHHLCILFCRHLNVFQEIGFRCVSKMVSIKIKSKCLSLKTLHIFRLNYL